MAELNTSPSVMLTTARPRASLACSASKVEANAADCAVSRPSACVSRSSKSTNRVLVDVSSV